MELPVPPSSPPPPPATGAGAGMPGWIPPAASAAGSSASTAIAAVGLVPAAFALLLLVMAPGFYVPLTERPLAGVAFVLALIAIPVIDVGLVQARAPGWLIAVVGSLGVVAGLFVVILAPAFLLIITNLATVD